MPKGLAGGVQASVTLQGRSGALELGDLFRQAIPFDSLDAQLWFEARDGHWQVQIPEVRVANEDAVAAARVAVYGSGDGASPFLDLRAHARGKADNGDHVARYVPAAILPDDFVHWLDTAVRGGTATEADAVFHGPLKRFPYDHHEGRFAVDVRVRDGELNYWRGWPGVNDIQAELSFRGRSMRHSL